MWTAAAALAPLSIPLFHRLRLLDSICFNFCCCRLPLHHTPLSVPTLCGGTFTILALICIVALWAILGAQRDQVPYIYTASIGGLSQEQQDLPLQATAGLSSSGMSGLTLMLTATSGSAGACADVSWSTIDLLAGSFLLESSAGCGNVAQHVLSCPDCVLKHGSRLLARLPWTCQAIGLQAYGVSSVGGLTAWSVQAVPDVQAAASSTAANAVVSLLSEVRWDVVPMLTLQTDATRSVPTRTRGYQVLGGTLATEQVHFYADAFLPSDTSFVDFVIDLSPSPIFQEVIMSERVPLDLYVTR